MAIEQTLGESPRDEPGPDPGLAMHSTLIGEHGSQRQAQGADESVRPGTQLGRYVVLEHLGAGGMGVVFTAWDPRLDRKLALKLLDPRPGSSNTGGRARLLREAQAMAQLEHPNVVTVHDVGTVNERVFIAMEFVDGDTLRNWLMHEAPEWKQILAVFRAAGQGLAAAHAVGLVHRDFKPDNVMVGRDGRVRVLDFGLARRGDESASTESAGDIHTALATDSAGSHSGDRPPPSSLGTLTRTGVLVGTPAYMSPEQFRCAALDPRSDQFSFCIALWEALANQRPFPGEHPAELINAVLTGERHPFPRTDIPASIVAALARGLSSEPEDRWPDMASLLVALTPPEPSRRYLWLIPSVLCVGLLAVTATVLLLPDSAPEPPASAAPIDCSVPDSRFAEAWSPDHAKALRANFSASQLSWAPSAATRIEAQLDAWTEQWRSEAEAACTDHYLDHALSSNLFDLRMGCLDQRLHETASLVELLSESSPNAELVGQASPAVSGLGRPDSCRDPEELRSSSSEDPVLAKKITMMRTALNRREQMQGLGMFEQGIAEGERLRPELELLDRPELWSRYWELRALDEMLLDEFDEALVSATKALSSGRRSQLPGQTLSAVLTLTRMTLRKGNIDESERWLILGEAIREEVEDPWFLYELHKARGFLAVEREDYEQTVTAFRSAHDIAREHFGPESVEFSWELCNYGRALIEAGTSSGQPARIARGFALYAESLALSARLLSADHPFVVGARIRHAFLLFEHEHLTLARQELAALEQIIPASYASDHKYMTGLASLRERALEHDPNSPATVPG